MVFASDQAGKKPIGLKLEIQDDLVLKLKGVERKLAISLPTNCHSVKDVKTYLIKQLFYDHQEIRFFLGDTIREVPDFSPASVFVAFKGVVIRVVGSRKPRSLEKARDSICIASSQTRKKSVQFDGTGQETKPPSTPTSLRSPNNALSTISSTTPIPPSTPEFRWTPNPDSDVAPSFSPITVIDEQSEGDTLREEDGKGTDAEGRQQSSMTRSAKRRERNRLSILRKSAAMNIQVQSGTTGGTDQLSEKENRSQMAVPQGNGQEQEQGASGNQPEDEVDKLTALQFSPTRRAEKRPNPGRFPPLPVFKQADMDGHQGGPKRKRKKRHAKTSIPLIQLPTVLETYEESDSSEDEDLPRWTNANVLPKITINPLGLAKLQLMQSLEDNRTFEAMAPLSYAPPPNPANSAMNYPGFDVHDFVQETIDEAERRVQLGSGDLNVGPGYQLNSDSVTVDNGLNPS